MRLSRRQFLALSATVVVTACAGDDTEPTTEAASVSDSVATTSPSSATSAPATSSATTAASSTTTASTAPPKVPPTTQPAVSLAADPFRLGVSSGDPHAMSVVLWTRLVGDDLPPSIDVVWELLDGDTVIDTGNVTAVGADGHAVHVVVDLDRPLSYRFRASGFTSQTGFTQPAGPRQQLTIASANCQHYETGFYAAYRDLAEWQPDLVLFLGDFIYEGPSRPVGGLDEGVPIVRSHDGPEPKDLAGYRARYAQYLGDTDLQAARAACPWLVIWDDHEVENNYAGLVAENPDEVPDFASRRAQAYRAWWEHMPTRLPAPVDEQPFTIYRAVEYGELALINVLDGRQFRSDQACGDIVLSVEPPCPEVFEPDRTMLGAEQEAWLAGQLAAGDDVVWNVLGQQTVLSDTRLDQAILNYDQWDGYPAARERLLALAPHDLIVITGDIHLAGVGQLGPSPTAASAGVEFVTTSISSTANIDTTLEELVRGLPGIVDVEIAHRGYVRHTVTAERWVADYRIVADVSDPASPVSTWKTFVVEHGSNTVIEQA